MSETPWYAQPKRDGDPDLDKRIALAWQVSRAFEEALLTRLPTLPADSRESVLHLARYLLSLPGSPLDTRVPQSGNTLHRV